MDVEFERFEEEGVLVDEQNIELINQMQKVFINFHI